MAREYFCAYHSYLEAMEPLNDAERGRLFTACLMYSMTGEVPEIRGNERFTFYSMKWKIDREIKSYTEKCAKNRANGMLGGKANGSERPRTVANGSERPPNAPQEEEKEEEKEKEYTSLVSPQGEKRHEHGEYGWVKLTDTEYARLLETLGQEELERCIRHIDESAQSSGNKNKWKDWNLVIRRCSREKWGMYSTSSFKEPASSPGFQPKNLL